MAVVGDKLLQPESGWRRYDDRDSRILYTGNWMLGSYSTTEYYLGTDTYVDKTVISTKTSHVIKFKFIGTKLRIIGYGHSSLGTSTCFVNIDGEEYAFSQTLTGSIVQACLNFEVLGLENREHYIQIYAEHNDTARWGLVFDAIDIDSTGYLLHPILNQKSSIEEMEIGDCIPFRYTASSGAVGAFSELGTCTANEIPAIGSATPNGLAYFAKVAESRDKKGGLLVADRNVQHSVSWNTLNAGKMIEGRKTILDYTKLLLHMDDANFVDECGHIVINNSNNAVLNTSIKKFGNGSAYMNAGSHSFRLSHSDDFEFGSGDFTIDCWIYPTNNSFGIFDKRTSYLKTEGMIIEIVSNSLVVNISTNGTAWAIANVTLATGLILNQWNHIAVCRSGNSLFGFINGVKGTPVSFTGSIYATTSDSYLLATMTGSIFRGYADEYRISKGIARWTQNFTPPSSPYDQVIIYPIRSLSGGNSYLDVNGNSTIDGTQSNISLGAWPPNNEWDTYIMKSDLNGKITPGDDNVWHKDYIFNWCQETSINGTWKSSAGTTITGDNTIRILRGYNQRTDNVWKGIALGTSSSGTSTYIGFRPALEYKLE